MRLSLALGILMLASGCRDARVSQANGELRLAPLSLEVPATWVGAESFGHVTASNAGMAPLDVELAIEAPFFVEASRFTLSGGEAREVAVRFRPEVPGRFSAMLNQAVLVSGEAAAMPQCPAARECTRARFDVDTGACAEEPADDGAACGAQNACLSGAVCSNGQCLGALLDCDDHNACTQDSCSPEMGCVHADISAQCPKAEGACQVATCDPQLGCGVGLASDGTSCGASDCKTAQVCIAGECETRTVPNGATCGTPSICQGPGTCQNQSCVLPPPSPLVPLWSYTPAPPRQLTFKGHVDLQGNSYFFEPVVTKNDAGYDDWSDLELVSLDKDGNLRWRTDLNQSCRYGCGYYLNMALDTDGERLFLVLLGNHLQARSLRDGKLLWDRDTTSGIPVRNPGTNGAGVFYTYAPMLLGSSNKVAVMVSEGNTDHWAHVVPYDRATGLPAARSEKKGHTYGTVSFGAGEFVMSSANCWSPAGEVAHFDGSGAQVATQFVSGEIKAGTSSTTFVRSYQTSSIVPSSGATIPLALSASQTVYDALLTGSRLLLTHNGTSGRYLSDYDATTGQPRWNRSLVYGTPPDIALMGDGSVFAAGANGTAGLVSRYDLDGKQTLFCPLTAVPTSPIAVRNGRYLVQQAAALSSFDVGTLDTARTGWAGQLGGPARDLLAR